MISKEAKMLLFFLAAFMVGKLWEFLPSSDLICDDLILFKKVPMYKNTFYFMVLSIVSNLILVSGFYFATTRYRIAVNIVFALYFLDLFDFWLFYGDKIFNLGSLKDFKFSYSFIKGICLVSIFSIIIMNEIYVAKRE